MSAHTPGPWKVVNHPRVAHVDSMRSVGHGANGMASIVWLTGGALAQEANARLIAAAPELLAEAEKQVEALRVAHITPSRGLLAAIAKARGGK